MSDYRQTNGGANSFRRVDAEAQQFVPVLRENWVIALRALGIDDATLAGNSVPYLLMPALGGSHALRGYSSWRFRDRNRLLLTGEYRWTAGPFVDMALFIDAGKVAARSRRPGPARTRRPHGIGLTIHTPTQHGDAHRAGAYARRHRAWRCRSARASETLEIAEF